METIIYQVISLLFLFVTVKGREYYLEWKEREKFRKELPKFIESMKRRAEMESKLNIMMVAMPFLIARAIQKKKDEEVKLKDGDYKN